MKKCKSGYKSRDGKCVKKKGWFSSSNKKSYNPFKMWGSWIGAGVGFILQIIYRDTYDIFGFMPEFTNTGFQLSIGWTSVGFLLGWVIHSLIRKIR